MPDLVSPKADLRDDDILVVGVVRNEQLRLPDFLAHHRRIGVSRFLLIDNASDDDTADYLLAQPDVTLFRTTERYSESACGVTWTNRVLQTYAAGHWTLILDADELFIFPGFETVRLRDFLTHLEQRGFDAVVAPMLDMYSDRPLARTGYEAGQKLLDACPYFDATGYEFTAPYPDTPDSPVVIHRGGARQRLFWDGHARSFPAPVLKKIPLVKWRRDLTLEASTHILKGARLAGVTGMLLHFKFLQDFYQAALREARRKEHYLGARQYTAYADILSSTPGLAAFWKGSVRFRDSRQLVDLGLMQVSDDYPFCPAANGQAPESAPEPGTAAPAQKTEKTEKTPETMTPYWQDFLVVNPAQKDLGGNLHHGDSLAITPGLWAALIDRFAPRSVLDAGAGEGHTLAFFNRKGVIAHGFDGLAENLAAARFPIALHDLKTGPYIYPCDLVHCVEVVEHIEAQYLDNLMDTLTNAPVVVMTHALPGQQGHHHVNARPESYWIEKFAARGYRLADDNDHFRDIAARERPGSYFSQSGLVLLQTYRLPGR